MEKTNCVIVKEKESSTRYILDKDDICEGYYLENDIYMINLTEEEKEKFENHEWETDDFIGDILYHAVPKGFYTDEDIEGYNCILLEDSNELITDVEEYFNDLEEVKFFYNG